MGYGKGNTGTGMHLFKRWHRPHLYYTDDQLAALGRKRASADQRNEILELAEKELDELNEEFWNLIHSSKGCTTEKAKSRRELPGSPFLSAKNLAFNLVAKLTGVDIGNIEVSYPYPALCAPDFYVSVNYDGKESEDVPEEEWDDDSWTVEFLCFYNPLEWDDDISRSMLMVAGTIECDLWVNDLAGYMDQRFTVFGPSELLRKFNGFLKHDAEHCSLGNVVLKMADWLMDAIGDCPYDHERLRYLSEMVADVMVMLARCLKDAKCRFYTCLDVKDRSVRNVSVDNGTLK